MLSLKQCKDIFLAYEQCVTRRPRDYDSVCRHLQSYAGWCALHEICEDEVQELEDCCRGSLMNISSYQHKKECKRALERIDTCIEVRQALAAQAAQNPTPNRTEVAPKTK